LCFLSAAAPLGRAEEPGKPEPPALNVLEGVVLDHAGKPVAGAQIHAADAERGFIHYGGPDSIFAHGPSEKMLWFFTKRNGAGSGEAGTGDDGRFVIRGLKPGRYSVLAVHGERGVGTLRDIVQPNEGHPSTIRLEPPTFVHGTIHGLTESRQFRHGSLHEIVGEAMPQIVGEAMPTRLNIYMGLNVNLGENGSFKVGPLPSAKSWRLSIGQFVMSRGFSATLLERDIDIEPGRTTTLDIDLTKGEQINGQIIGPEGTPLDLVAVDVALKGSVRANRLGALTDKEGRFRISGLEAGVYTLDAKRWLKRTKPG
jgi:hypothetical protein